MEIWTFVTLLFFPFCRPPKVNERSQRPIWADDEWLKQYGHGSGQGEAPAREEAAEKGGESAAEGATEGAEAEAQPQKRPRVYLGVKIGIRFDFFFVIFILFFHLLANFQTVFMTRNFYLEVFFHMDRKVKFIEQNFWIEWSIFGLKIRRKSNFPRGVRVHTREKNRAEVWILSREIKKKIYGLILCLKIQFTWII